MTTGLANGVGDAFSKLGHGALQGAIGGATCGAIFGAIYTMLKPPPPEAAQAGRATTRPVAPRVDSNPVLSEAVDYIAAVIPPSMGPVVGHIVQLLDAVAATEESPPSHAALHNATRVQKELERACDYLRVHAAQADIGDALQALLAYADNIVHNMCLD